MMKMITEKSPNNSWMVIILFAVMSCITSPVSAGNFFRRLDSLLAVRYYNSKIDTNYVVRPKTKWTLKARYNLSGNRIESEGREMGSHFKSEINSNFKSTFSVGATYRGFSLALALNPAKLAGKYRDYEINLNSYGKSFGWDFIYQNAKNFNGWYDQDGKPRIDLPADKLTVITFNMNLYYAFNNKKFSYPAAFSQSYIQKRSAGSFLLAASGMHQRANYKWEETIKLLMTNIGIGAGYAYNFVPGKGWLLHISALPTFIVYSHTSVKLNDVKVPLHYNFPEVIITGRGAVVHQIKNIFYGLSMVYNFSNIGSEETLTVHNQKWRLRAFFGIRL